VRIALDTNRYSDFARGTTDVVDVLEAATEVVLPFAAVAELRAGFLYGSRGTENEEGLRRFLRRPGVSVAFPDDQTTRIYADLAVQLRRRGTPIPMNDIWIASIALQHDLALYARDKHFDHLPQLRRA
jgi:tRNA(fMet)-specific endonuclease VapC